MLGRAFRRVRHKVSDLILQKNPAKIAGLQKWSIGMYVGPSPLQLLPSSQIKNPVLTAEDVSDCRAALVADPFMINVADRWHMFFEVFNLDSGKGEIGWATSTNARNWTYQHIVLAEPFHMSYPYVFEWKNDYYMIPETVRAGALRLYKAFNFPTLWSLVGILRRGRLADPSVVRYQDKWWLFAETNPEIKSDTLRLYSADDLLGPWTEHPKSPIFRGNPHIARPAGRVLSLDGRLLRFTQDCFPEYGTAVRAFSITELTSTTYRETPCSEELLLHSSGKGWNKSGMHHVDPHCTGEGQWIACVDGSFFLNKDA